MTLAFAVSIGIALLPLRQPRARVAVFTAHLVVSAAVAIWLVSAGIWEFNLVLVLTLGPGFVVAATRLLLTRSMRALPVDDHRTGD